MSHFRSVVARPRGDAAPLVHPVLGVAPSPGGERRRARRAPAVRPARTVAGALVVVLGVAALATGAGAQAATAGAVGTVTGTVTEGATGRPVANAQVFLPATRQGASTDTAGAFVIRNVAAGTTTLRVQTIGFAPLERVVTVPAGGRVAVSVAIARSAVALSEVVVTATGEERRRSVGNAIATIDSTELRRAPVTNTQDILTARATGVTLLQNSGQPGAGGTIRLRGVNSVSQGNRPIVYVDGVRMYNGITGTNLSGRQATLPLNDVNAADIERVEIVKGPAATTLYGTEASGGVIQIFTKQGRSGTPAWSLDASAGANTMGHVGPDSDPTGLFVNRCRGAGLVNGEGVAFEDPTCPASGSWLRAGPVQRYALGARGGAGTVSYYLSGTFNDERGVLPTGGNRDRGVRGNVTFRPARGLDVAFNTSLVNRTVEWFPDGNNGNGFLLNVSRGPGSSFKGPGCASATITCVVNDSLFRVDATTTSNHFITGGTATFAPNERVSVRVAAGYDYNNYTNTTLVPFGYLRTPTGDYVQSLTTRHLGTLDLAATWRQPLGASFASSASVGGQLFESRVYTTGLQATNFSGPGEPTLVSGSLRTITDVEQLRVVNAGVFAQEQLAWRDRLFVTAGVRVDGNSAFGTSFGLQTYPKLSVSWVASDEAFWPTRWVETLKLRGAVGESGKAPGAFDAVRTWEPISAENGQPAFTPSQVGNADLGPERTRELEVGFDASAFGGRLGVEYTYYAQHTLDALVPVTLPPSQGFTNRQLMNVGELFNHGNEVTLRGRLVSRPAAEWMARLGFTTFRSRAGDVGGQTLTIDALARSFVREGLPVPSYVGMRVTNPDAIADPVIEQDAFLATTFPTRIITPATTLTLWGRLTLDALGEWQLGGHLLNAIGYQNANLRVWQPCYDVQAKLRAAAAGDAGALGDVTAMERARCTLNSAARDYSFWVEDSDFFRLRSVSLSYDLPPRLIPGTRAASVTVAGRNLFTSTRYTGTDPEVADQRDNTFSRRDYYTFPAYRTVLVTVRTSF